MAAGAQSPSALAQLVRRYHRGEINVDNAELEQRFFGTARCTIVEPLGAALARLGVQKFEEDEARYDLIRGSLALLPRPDMTLLDVGSGGGRVMLYAALLGAPNVHGIEILERRVEFARAAAAAHGIASFAIDCGDALDLPWPPAQVLMVNNPFYPSAYKRLHARLVDYASAHDPIIVSSSTLKAQLAEDDAFLSIGETSLDWSRYGAFRLRGF